MHTHGLGGKERLLRSVFVTIGSRVQEAYNEVVAELATAGSIPEEMPDDEEERARLAEHLILPVLQVAAWTAVRLGMPLSAFLCLVGAAYEHVRSDAGREPPTDAAGH